MSKGKKKKERGLRAWQARGGDASRGKEKRARDALFFSIMNYEL